MLKIFDTHAHYDDAIYDTDRELLINGFPEQGVGAVTNIGTNFRTSEITAQLTRQYENVYGVVGIYPSEVDELEEGEYSAGMNQDICDPADSNHFDNNRNKRGLEYLGRLVQEYEKVIAIGEIGLDYHYDDTDRPLQKKWFIKQMELARTLHVPIVVHSRDAAKDTVDIMRQCDAGDIGGVIHCYSYTKELARDFLDMGFYFGIGGVLTFKNSRKLKEAVAYIPMEHIVLETDSPYLTPEPYRGRRNTSANLPYVAQAIADIKGIRVDEVYEATWNNAHRLYRIKER